MYNLVFSELRGAWGEVTWELGVFGKEWLVFVFNYNFNVAPNFPSYTNFPFNYLIAPLTLMKLTTYFHF